MEIINEESEKFRDKQDEICGLLFDLLRKIDEIEKDVFNKSEELKRKKAELGIPKHQVGPGEEELWDEYGQRLGEVAKPAFTEKLIKRRYGGSYGKPSKYNYIGGECTATFIMKTAKRAVVQTDFMHGTPQSHKFVIRDVDGKWLVDEVYYGFQSNPEKWYSDNIR